MMGKIMKRNDFGKIVNYTMKGNNKSKLLAAEGVRSDSKQHIRGYLHISLKYIALC